jgi:CBS domain-containing protein
LFANRLWSNPTVKSRTSSSAGFYGKRTLHARTAADLMTEDGVSIDHGAPLHRAVATLVDRKFSAAPATDVAGRPIGVLSMPDVIIHDRNTVAYARAVPEYYVKADLQGAIGESADGFRVEVAGRTPVGT